MQITVDKKALKKTLSRFRPIVAMGKKADMLAFRFSLKGDSPLSQYRLAIAMVVSRVGVYLETSMPVTTVSADMLGTETFVNAAEVYKAIKTLNNPFSDTFGLTWDADDEAGCIFRDGSSVSPQSYFVSRAPVAAFPDVNAESLCHVVNMPFAALHDATTGVRYAAAKTATLFPLNGILVAAVDGGDATDVVACNKSQLAITRLTPSVPYSFLLPLGLADNLFRVFGKPVMATAALEIAMTTPSSLTFSNACHHHREVRLRHGETTLYLMEGKPGDFPPYTSLLPQFSAGAAVRFEVYRDVLINATRACNVRENHNFFMLIGKDTVYLWKQFKDKSPYEAPRTWFEEPLTNVSYRPDSETYTDTVPGLPEAGFVVRCDAARLCTSLAAQPETVLCWLRLPADTLCFVNEALLTSQVPFNARDAASATLGMLACG